MKLKNDKPPNPNTRRGRTGFRANADEKQKLQALADQYTKGDVSKWCRYAAMNFRPTKKDLEE